MVRQKLKISIAATKAVSIASIAELNKKKTKKPTQKQLCNICNN